MNAYSLSKINDRCADPDQREWVIEQIERLHSYFQQDDMGYSSNDPQTQEQCGFLAGAMNLADDDRHEMLSILVGFELHYDGTPLFARLYANQNLKERVSSKDRRITRHMAKMMLDFYNSGPGQDVNDALGYPRLADLRAKARIERKAAAEEKKARRLAERQEREAKRLAAKARKSGAQLSS